MNVNLCSDVTKYDTFLYLKHMTSAMRSLGVLTWKKIKTNINYVYLSHERKVID